MGREIMSDIGKWYEQWSHSSGSIIDESFQSEKKEVDDIVLLIKNNKQIYMNPAYKRYAKNVTMSIVDPSYIYSKVIGGIVPVKLYKNIPKHQKYDSVYKFGFDKDEKHNVVICFKRCYDINFSHWIEYKKTPDYAHLTIGQIPYFIQKIDVSNKNEKLEFKINAWPLDLYVLCAGIDVSYKDRI